MACAKITLHFKRRYIPPGYIFYEPDDDFAASVICLYSNNALLFLPVDGLADVGEYCSKKICNYSVNIYGSRYNLIKS